MPLPEILLRERITWDGDEQRMFVYDINIYMLIHK